VVGTPIPYAATLLRQHRWSIWLSREWINHVQCLAILIFDRLMAAMRVKASNSKVKPAPAVETSESINEQIAAFLKSGGEIQQIAKGVSGQTFTPSKHISLGKK
jgi:hypothetical protein